MRYNLAKYNVSNRARTPSWLALVMTGSLAVAAVGCAANGEAAGTLGSEVRDNPRSGKITCTPQKPESWGRADLSGFDTNKYADALHTSSTNVASGKQGPVRCERLVDPSEVGNLVVSAPGAPDVTDTCIVISMSEAGAAPKGAAIGANDRVRVACPA